MVPLIFGNSHKPLKNSNPAKARTEAPKPMPSALASVSGCLGFVVP